jgi:hypothetical protein
MFIPDPDYYPSRIPDPNTSTKERGEKKIFIPFFVATNFTIQNKRKKFGPIFKNFRTF